MNNDYKRIFDELNYKLDMCKFSNLDKFNLAYSLMNLIIYDETSEPEKNFNFNEIFKSLGYLATLKEEIFYKH